MRNKEAKKTWNKVCEKYLGIVQRQYENRKLSVQFEIDAFGENKPLLQTRGFLDGPDSKESACNAADMGLIPGSERAPREGNGYPFRYCCLQNSMDRGAWWATVHAVAKSWT